MAEWFGNVHKKHKGTVADKVCVDELWRTIGFRRYVVAVSNTYRDDISDGYSIPDEKPTIGYSIPDDTYHLLSAL